MSCFHSPSWRGSLLAVGGGTRLGRSTSQGFVKLSSPDRLTCLETGRSYCRSPAKWSAMRARIASLQTLSLAWLQAARTAKSFVGASQATASHMELLPEWVRAGPPAQG